MDKKLKNLLFAMSLVGTSEFQYDYINDPMVNECLIYMYFYLMYDSSVDKKEEMFQEFSRRYNELNAEQKEMVKQDYLNILEAQEKNKDKARTFKIY